LKIKLKGRHFDTTVMMEAESQAVLNTLTGHDFQDAKKNGRSVGNGAYVRKGIISRVIVARGPKLIFDQTAASVPEIMGSSLYASSLIK
jgi:hypothetical protein